MRWLSVVSASVVIAGCFSKPPRPEGTSDGDGGVDARPIDGAPGTCAMASDPDLVVYLPLNETAGTSAPDQSSYSHDGTLSGGAEWQPGKLGNGVTFDGVDGAIELGDHMALRNLPAVTVCAWVLPEYRMLPPVAATIADKSADGYGGGWNAYLDTEGSGVRLGFSTSSHSYATGNLPLPNKEWTHVCTTWNGTAGFAGIHLYRDGVEEQFTGTDSGMAIRDNDTGNPLVLGKQSNTQQYQLEGALDEVLIYKRALTSQEITTVYSCM